MKKKLIFLTGIVLLITVLAAGACNRDAKPSDSETVKIYLKATTINGKKHLKMYDSNDRSVVVIDSLHIANVEPGDEVIWKLKWFSGVKKVKEIGPGKPGKIIDKNAEIIPGSKKFKLKIPDNAPRDSKEKYDIIFEDKDGNTWHIDPYLRIPKKPREN